MGIILKFTSKLLSLGLLLAVLLVAANSQAQQFNQKQVQLIDGKTYYLHKVEKGNTLYSLSKAYSIKIKDLLSENPQLEEGLKLGQVIRIPVKKVDTKLTGGNAPTLQGDTLIHEVLPKETLYALTKRYGVSAKDLQKANPALKDGLKIGMELIIPQPEEAVKGVDESALKPAEEDSFLLHFVEPQQTLYSLALEYDVNIDSIRIVNGGLKDGLKVGTTIRIPLAKKESLDLASDLAVEDSAMPSKLVLDATELKNKYVLSLLVPFYLDSTDTLNSTKLAFEQKEIYGPSKIGVEFYTGFKFAAEKFNSDSVSFDVRVHDISIDMHTRSTEDVAVFVNSEEFFETDLIVGPFHRTNFQYVANYAKKVKKPIVCPVPQRNSVLDSNIYAIKVFSSEAAQVDFMRSFTLKKWAGKNLVLVKNSEMKDVVLAERFMGIAHGDTNASIYADITSKVKMFNLNSDADTNGLGKLMDDSLENVIVMPVQSKAAIGRFLTKINRYSNDYNVKVVGLESWNSMGYLEYRYLNNLNVHTVRNQYLEYQDTINQAFVLEYRNTFETEPSKWALLGYDVANYFLSSMEKSGTVFQRSFGGETQKGYSKNFKFQQVSPVSGYENKALKMVKVENYQYIEVNDEPQ